MRSERIMTPQEEYEDIERLHTILRVYNNQTPIGKHIFYYRFMAIIYWVRFTGWIEDVVLDWRDLAIRAAGTVNRSLHK